jgi:hypothetical protein
MVHLSGVVGSIALLPAALAYFLRRALPLPVSIVLWHTAACGFTVALAASEHMASRTTWILGKVRAAAPRPPPACCSALVERSAPARAAGLRPDAALRPARPQTSSGSIHPLGLLAFWPYHAGLRAKLAAQRRLSSEPAYNRVASQFYIGAWCAAAITQHSHQRSACPRACRAGGGAASGQVPSSPLAGRTAAAAVGAAAPGAIRRPRCAVWEESVVPTASPKSRITHRPGPYVPNSPLRAGPLRRTWSPRPTAPCWTSPASCRCRCSRPRTRRCQCGTRTVRKAGGRHAASAAAGTAAAAACVARVGVGLGVRAPVSRLPSSRGQY